MSPFSFTALPACGPLLFAGADLVFVQAAVLLQRSRLVGTNAQGRRRWHYYFRLATFYQLQLAAMNYGVDSWRAIFDPDLQPLLHNRLLLDALLTY